MHITQFSMLSGINASAATGYAEVFGIDTFTIGYFASGIGAPATGTLTIQARLNSSLPYATIYSTGIASNNTGLYFQFNGPYESISSIITSTTGIFSVYGLGGYNPR